MDSVQLKAENSEVLFNFCLTLSIIKYFSMTNLETRLINFSVFLFSNEFEKSPDFYYKAHNFVIRCKAKKRLKFPGTPPPHLKSKLYLV